MTWGHERDKDGHVFPSKVYPYNRMHSPSSNLHSNVEDMARWMIANLNRGELDGKRVLKAASHDELWKPSVDAGKLGRVGLSWFLSEYKGTQLVTHSGTDDGFMTCVVLVPAKKVGVVVLINCDEAPLNRVLVTALDVAAGWEEEK